MPKKVYHVYDSLLCGYAQMDFETREEAEASCRIYRDQNPGCPARVIGPVPKGERGYI